MASGSAADIYVIKIKKGQIMKTTAKILKILGHIWMTLFFILLVVSIIGIFIGEGSFVKGWLKFTEIFSPFNFINYIVMLILALPAVGFYKGSEYLEKKQK